MMNKVAAVVVTYNRKKILVECIDALLNQDDKNMDIFIIDNASTDGTFDYISKYVNNNSIVYCNTGKNIGGAGGFNYGIKKAVESNYDFIWIMDDDTIPMANTLSELLKADKLLCGKYGFLSSSVLWTDGTPCKMNRQKISRDWYKESQYLKHSILKSYHATFVSLFIRADVVKKVGLPIKEFFIWGDDVEYTNRISKIFDNFIVGSSQVVHKINNNEGSNIAQDVKERIPRYKYAYRNEMYIAKKNGIKGIAYQIAKIGLHLSRVLFSKKGSKLKKIWIILFSSFKGVFFCPSIEYIEENEGAVND